MTTPSPKPGQSQSLSTALAIVAGLGGFVTLGIVVGVLLVGLWLDRTLETRPLFTILLMVMSAPLSIFVMYKVAMSAIARLNPPPPQIQLSPQPKQGEAKSEL